MLIDNVFASLHGWMNAFADRPEYLFAIWIAVGIVALVVGALVVRASTRRLRRAASSVDRTATFAGTVSSQPSGIRAAA